MPARRARSLRPGADGINLSSKSFGQEGILTRSGSPVSVAVSASGRGANAGFAASTVLRAHTQMAVDSGEVQPALYLGQDSTQNGHAAGNGQAETDNADEVPVHRGLDVNAARRGFRQHAVAISSSVSSSKSSRPNIFSASFATGMKRVQSMRQERGRSSLLKRFCGVGPASLDVPKSSLIFPTSPFSLGWAICSGLLLLYTAVVTPPVIAFFWHADQCDFPPTLYADIVADAFFILDIFLSFNTGLILNGNYVDKWSAVAYHYVTHSFLFDITTSIPVSFIELYIKIQCDHSDGEKQETGNMGLRLVRVLKPIRWLKLARIFKMSKLKNIGSKVADKLGVPPRHVRVCTVILSIVVGTHLFASAFWFVKVLTQSPDQIEDFLSSHGSDVDSVQGKIRTYVTCFYFIITVWTSVGFGDISATSTSEQVFLIVTMLTGSLVLAKIIAEVQDMSEQAQRVEFAKASRVQLALDFLAEHHVPEELQHQIVEWTRFSVHQEMITDDRNTVLTSLPEPLQRKLTNFLLSPKLCRVSILGLIDSIDDWFMVEVCKRLYYETIIVGDVVISMYEPADRLILVTEGSCEVEIEDSDENIQLYAGQWIGDYALLGELDWGGSALIGMPERAVEMTAKEHLVCVSLPVTSFAEIIAASSFRAKRQFRVFGARRAEALQTEAQTLFDPDGWQHVPFRSEMTEVQFMRFSRKLLRKEEERRDGFGRAMLLQISQAQIRSHRLKQAAVSDSMSAIHCPCPAASKEVETGHASADTQEQGLREETRHDYAEKSYMHTLQLTQLSVQMSQMSVSLSAAMTADNNAIRQELGMLRKEIGQLATRLCDFDPSTGNAAPSAPSQLPGMDPETSLMLEDAHVSMALGLERV